MWRRKTPFWLCYSDVACIMCVVIVYSRYMRVTFVCVGLRGIVCILFLTTRPFLTKLAFEKGQCSSDNCLLCT